ncbi:MAG: MFS transporter [Actinomycetes bacterium]|nr:MAG: MFS transporter [Actinomycetota bacterium]
MPQFRPVWSLTLASVAQFLLQMNFASANVALPAIRSDLGFDAATLQWVVTGYALTYGALLLLGGRFGDLVGHRRSLLIGLVAFALSALAGGVAVSGGMLIGARLAQGASAAMVPPALLALVTGAYVEPAARARALGIFQGSTAAGAAAGIVLGGFLVQAAGWRWVLLVNTPLVAVLIAAILWGVPPSMPRRGTRLDIAGGLTATGAIAALILGVTQARESGAAMTAVTLAVAAALAAAFVVVERRGSDPMLPGELVRGERAVVLVANLIVGLVLAGYVYFVSLYLQLVLGYSPLMTGLALFPATMTGMTFSMFVSGRLLPAIGERWQGVASLVLLMVGQLWLAQVRADGTYLVDVLGGILFTAAGVGLALPALSVAVTAGVAPHRRGVAGALFVAGQQIGGAIGVAVLVGISAAGTAAGGSLVAGYGLAFLSTAVLALIGAVTLGITTVRGRRSQVPQA